jgi:ubiquinone/menaquinone biosynthesis C-methylase UbiE
VTVGNEQLRRIQSQFRRQADAYERLASVSDMEAQRRLAALSRVSGAERALDVCCGPGFLTVALAERCREAVGLDGTDVFVAHARSESRRRGLANLRFVLGDAEHMPLADGTFDVVTCRAAFHHLPVPEAALREMIRVSTPRARFVIADMVGSDDPNTAAGHDEVERLCDPTHVRALPEAEFESLFASLELAVVFKSLTRSGYAVEEWIAHGGPPEDRAEEIRRRLRASIDGDRLGLAVHVESGELRFSHAVAAFVVEKREGRY